MRFSLKKLEVSLREDGSFLVSGTARDLPQDVDRILLRTELGDEYAADGILEWVSVVPSNRRDLKLAVVASLHGRDVGYIELPALSDFAGSEIAVYGPGATPPAQRPIQRD